jgi:hypothetical protein
VINVASNESANLSNHSMKMTSAGASPMYEVVVSGAEGQVVQWSVGNHETRVRSPPE